MRFTFLSKIEPPESFEMGKKMFDWNRRVFLSKIMKIQNGKQINNKVSFTNFEQ